MPSIDQELRDVTRRLKRALDDIKDDKERERINKEAGKIVAQDAARRAPKSKRPHYMYHTPKVIKSRRAKRGSALSFRTKYIPGNLRLSIRVLSLRQAVRAVVGPKFLRNPRAKSYGKNRRNVNAFYAQMIYGSARAFRDRIMGPALVAKERQVRAFMDKEVEKLKDRAAKKHGLE